MPPNVSLGPIPNDVFVNGFRLPGLLIGVKESRVLGKLLLCFANSNDCSLSLTYLQKNRGQPIFRTFSGAPSMLPLQFEQLEQQVLSSIPMPEELPG